MNTFFKLPVQKSIQIGCIIIDAGFKKLVESAKTYPEADIPTVHNLLLSTIKVRLKRIGTKNKEIRKDFNAVNIEPGRS